MKIKSKMFIGHLPQYEFIPGAYYRIAEQFKWTQMAVITQTENLLTSVISFGLIF